MDQQDTPMVEAYPLEKLPPTEPLPSDHPEYDYVPPPEVDVGKRPPGKYCMARRKNPEEGEVLYCTNVAGKGTDHVGAGRCKYHGGATPVKHGMYSSVTRYSGIGGPIGELYEKYTNSDTDPLDMTPELALTRALIEDYIANYEEFKETLYQWRDAYASHHDTEPPKLNLPSIHSAHKMVETLSKSVDRVQRRREASAISLKELFRTMAAMGNIVKEAINDDTMNKDDKLRFINKQWSKLVPK
jgi:hypothetical protein